MDWKTKQNQSLGWRYVERNLETLEIVRKIAVNNEVIEGIRFQIGKLDARNRPISSIGFDSLSYARYSHSQYRRRRGEETQGVIVGVITIVSS